MPPSKKPYRGRVQAQGDDIDQDQKGGYSKSWARDSPATVQDGFSFIKQIEEQCNSKQKSERKVAFTKARNFIRRAGEQGGVGPEMVSRSFQDRNRTVRNARVDIEVLSGLNFVPDKDNQEAK